MLTDDVIRELASFKGRSAPVTSCYLDVDGSRFVRHVDYEHELDRLLKAQRAKLTDPRDEGTKSLLADLEKIEEHVKRGFDRSHTRGLALFACAIEGFWQVIELPVPVRNQLVVNHTPHVRQLEAAVENHERFGVLLADRQRARMFVFQLGELVDKSELFELLPRHEDDGGDRRKDDVRAHAQEIARQHLKHAAQVAFHVWKEKAFDHLIIGAPDDIATELERDLHPYLRSRLAGRVNVAANAREDQIRSAALAVEDGIERAKEAARVEKLRNSLGAGNGAVVGLGPTLQALVERRVETLLVSDGFEAPGWRCPSCAFVGIKGRTCPVCSTAMEQVDDVVEEAVEEALGQSCKVDVCVNADLDVLGRIGALLRF